MRAESVKIDVSFEVDDNDFYVATADKTFTDVSVSDLVDYIGAKIAYDGDLDYVDMDDLVYSGGYLNMTVEVYRVNGANKGRTDITGTQEATDLLNGSVLANDYDIELSFEIDYIGHDNGTVVGYGNGVDDRKDEIVTLKVEGWDEGKDEATGKYSTTEYVADDKDTLEGILNSLYDSNVVDGDIYELVFYVNGTTVTGVWEKEPEKNIVWNAGNSLDLNGDGKVSCDEYYGTTGLVWSDEKNACVVESNGAVVVTIPNTATK